MTKYLSSEPFSISQAGRDPKECKHGWMRQDRRGVHCVLCGQMLMSSGVVERIGSMALSFMRPLDEYIVYANSLETNPSDYASIPDDVCIDCGMEWCECGERDQIGSGASDDTSVDL